MNRYEPQQIKCRYCKKTEKEILGLMVTHNKGRWVTYEDYKLIKNEYNKLKKQTIIPIKNLTLKK